MSRAPKDYHELMAELKPLVRKYTQASIGQVNIFLSLNKGINIITPERIAFLSLDGGKHIVEVSYGTGMSGEYHYGVTVVSYNQEGEYYRDTALSQLKQSLSDLDYYLAELDGQHTDDDDDVED